MGYPLRKADRRYTYGDYKEWPDDERWELIDGVAWDLSSAHNRFHQGVSVNLSVLIANFLEGNECKVYHAPFDVLLPAFDGQEEDDVDTVVQPDISVICNPDRLTYKGCTGAPDWIIEILSPYTSKKDIDIKHHLYERHGVREYWLVDPGNRYLHVYVLDGDVKYPEEPRVYLPGDQVESAALTGLVVEVEQIFPE